VFASLVMDKRTNGRKNERTSGQPENTMPLPVTLAWRRHVISHQSTIHYYMYAGKERQAHSVPENNRGQTGVN